MKVRHLISIFFILFTISCGSVQRSLIGTWDNKELALVILNDHSYSIERKNFLKTAGTYSLTGKHNMVFNFPGLMGCVIFKQQGVELSNCNKFNIEFVLSDDALVLRLPNGDSEWFTKKSSSSGN